ncbi:MAG: 16S rRNA (adenine(1518)-N(6)/adenine(1519)-N(6))-dimethyltransferase RsmA [Actinomycetota bacterium]|nr:16S rRNA (adenine(1518)-N(6)/adenine(1519)-N(6))-dimethyltransferase RsmA [Actinomycetota bacterium]
MTMRGRAAVAAVLERYGLHPSRALGQNFVVDPATVERIARLAELTAGQRVVEIGAGLGALTVALADTGALVTAIERDRHLLAPLGEAVEGRNVDVLCADALRVDWGELCGSAPGEEWSLVANLPYNIATPLVLGVLERAPAVTTLLVMVQREVGLRYVAHVGDEAFGAVSVKIAYFATSEIVGSVSPSVFLPRPRVASVIVRMRRNSAPAVDPAVASYGALVRLVNAGFGLRRKMLRGSLAGLVGPAAFAAARVSPEARAETLSLDDWGRLAAAVAGPATAQPPADGRGEGATNEETGQR